MWTLDQTIKSSSFAAPGLKFIGKYYRLFSQVQRPHSSSGITIFMDSKVILNIGASWLPRSNGNPFPTDEFPYYWYLGKLTLHRAKNVPQVIIECVNRYLKL